MRFIIREMDYEIPLASGKLLYEMRGRPTGVIEEWRLTAAVDGYRFLRVDLDAREAASRESTLYHLTLNSAGRSERLKFRYYGPDTQVIGDVMLDKDSVTLTRKVRGHRFEDETNLSSGYGFWFPSALGLSLLAGIHHDGDYLQAATVNKDEEFALTSYQVQLKASNEESLATTGQTVAVWPCLIRWPGFDQTIWLDSYSLPVKLDRGDGTSALESRYVRFQHS